MKARVSADPKVDKDHDDPNKDSQGQDEDQVEKKDSPNVATLQDDQEEEVHDSQSKRGAVFRSEGAEQPSCDPNHPTGTRPVTRGQLKLRLSNQQMRGWQDSQQEFQVYLQSKEKEVEATRTGMEEKYGKGFWEMDNEGKWVHDYQGPGGAIRIRETSRYLGLLRVERNLMEARNTLKIQEERDITIQALEGDAGAGSVSGANASTGIAPGADAGAGEPATEEAEDPVGEALRKRESDIWKMIGEVCDEGLKFTDGTEKEEQKATTQALVGVTKTLEVQIKSHLKKIKLETRTLKRRLKKKKKRKLKKEGALSSCVSDTNNGAGTGAGSMETETQEPNAEVEKHKVDALLSMNDARLEHLIGRDNYMAITQAQAQEAQESVIASGTADAPETDRQMRVRQRNIKRRKKEKEDERKKAKKTKEDESKAGPSNWRRSGDGPGSGRWGDMTTGEEQVITDLVTEEEQMVRDLCDITGCTEEQCAEALATHSSENRSREEIWNFAYDMLKLIL